MSAAAIWSRLNKRPTFRRSFNARIRAHGTLISEQRACHKIKFTSAFHTPAWTSNAAPFAITEIKRDGLFFSLKTRGPWLRAIFYNAVASCSNESATLLLLLLPAYSWHRLAERQGTCSCLSATIDRECLIVSVVTGRGKLTTDGRFNKKMKRSTNITRTSVAIYVCVTYFICWQQSSMAIVWRVERNSRHFWCQASTYNTTQLREKRRRTWKLTRLVVIVSFRQHAFLEIKVLWCGNVNWNSEFHS